MSSTSIRWPRRYLVFLFVLFSPVNNFPSTFVFARSLTNRHEQEEEKGGSCWATQLKERWSSFLERDVVQRTVEYLNVGADVAFSVAASATYVVTDLNSFVSDSIRCSFGSYFSSSSPFSSSAYSSQTSSCVVTVVAKDASAVSKRAVQKEEEVVPQQGRAKDSSAGIKRTVQKEPSRALAAVPLQEAVVPQEGLERASVCLQQEVAVGNLFVPFEQFEKLNIALVVGQGIPVEVEEDFLNDFMISARVRCADDTRRPSCDSFYCRACRWSGVVEGWCKSCENKWEKWEKWKSFFSYVVGTTFMTVSTRGGERTADLEWCEDRYTIPLSSSVYMRRYLADEAIRWVGLVATAAADAVPKQYDWKVVSDHFWESLCGETVEQVSSLVIVENKNGGGETTAKISVRRIAREALRLESEAGLKEHLQDFCQRLVEATQYKYDTSTKYW
eukprot:GHVS01000147.1.p1 GENE.GHVS01000147.1~~GHVS01000147.1.p1  ORF type:complete len:445 (+),score=56.54 GHVS01000147.1:153-1487(+)